MKVTIHPGKIGGEVIVPASKSLTHRAVILATLAEGESVIENWLSADDTRVTIEACRQFGADIREEDGKLVIQGTGGIVTIPRKPIDCGLSGTSLRLLTAVAALVPGEVRLTGGARLMERPMEAMLVALRHLGTKAQSDGKHISIEGGTLDGGNIVMSGDVSSQFISALLMVAPYAQSVLHIELQGVVRSRPYIDLTLGAMNAFGADVKADDRVFTVSPHHYHAIHYRVEHDWSAAQYWVAAATVTGGAVSLKDMDKESVQGDKMIVEIAERMGCMVQMVDKNITVTGPRALRALEIDGGDIPDLVPTIAVMAAFAPGASKIANIAHLRDKESDRLAVPVMELAKMGIHAEATDDSLIVYGGKPKGAIIDSHHDHRIAMAFAVAGLVAEGETIIEDGEAVTKSYPGFWDDFEKLGGKVLKE